MVITAEAALVSLQQGQISAVELLQLYLERIKQREPLVGAWETLGLDSALQQAQRCDAAQAAGQPLAPLHGIPIGIKDTVHSSAVQPCQLPFALS